MVELQKPKYIYFGGKIRPWDEATIHVSSEAVFRGLNVFEGLKAYWQVDGSMGVVALERHYQRFIRSAALLHMPFDLSWPEFEDAVHGIIEALCEPENHIWVRATLYMMEGHWGENQKTDLCLQAFQSAKGAPEPIKIGVSTWKRAQDVMLPARIKTSSNYQVARLAKIEGRKQGFAEMVLLNDRDRVAETGGSCILMVRDGRVAAPPASEGALESLTLELVEALAAKRGIPFDRRPIDRTELYIADEIALVGTLAEVTPVVGVDDYQCSGKDGLLDVLGADYLKAVTEGWPEADLSIRRYG